MNRMVVKVELLTLNHSLEEKQKEKKKTTTQDID